MGYGEYVAAVIAGLERDLMSFGKMSEQIQILRVVHTKDADGFAASCDEPLAHAIKAFKGGKLSLGVEDIGVAAATDLTGASVDDNGVLVAASEDDGCLVAVGFRALKPNNTFRYFWLYRVKFAVPSTNLQTKGDSISSDPRRRRTVWQCNEKYGKDEICRAPHLTEEQVEAAFLEAFNQRITNRAEIFAAYDEVLAALTDTAALDAEAAALTEECEVVMELTHKAVQENASAALDQAAYQERYDALVARYNTAHARLGEIEAARTERRAKRANIDRFLKTLARQENLVTEFDEEL